MMSASKKTAHPIRGPLPLRWVCVQACSYIWTEIKEISTVYLYIRVFQKQETLAPPLRGPLASGMGHCFHTSHCIVEKVDAENKTKGPNEATMSPRLAIIMTYMFYSFFRLT